MASGLEKRREALAGANSLFDQMVFGEATVPIAESPASSTLMPAPTGAVSDPSEFPVIVWFAPPSTSMAVSAAFTTVFPVTDSLDAPSQA